MMIIYWHRYSTAEIQRELHESVIIMQCKMMVMGGLIMNDTVVVRQGLLQSDLRA